MAAKTIAFVNKNDAGSTVRTYNLPFGKYDATAAPGVNDDDTAGYVAGSPWADRTNHNVYICLDNATGAASWLLLGSLADGTYGDIVVTGSGATWTIGSTMVQDVISLTDPGADRLAFWDDSAGHIAWLTLGTNLSITGTTIDAAGGGGGVSGTGTDNHVVRWDGTSAVQDSGVVIDDTDNITGVTSISLAYAGLKLKDTGGQHMVIHPVCNTGTFAGDRVLQIGMPDANTTLTLGGDLTTSGSFTTTLTVTGNTNVTLPTSGTLITQTQADAAYQPLDATLTALAAANWAANALPIGTGADTLSQTAFAANTFPARASTGNLVAKTITDFGLSLVDDTDAAAGRTTLGGTTVGQNFFTLTNPSAVTFPRMNADNTVSALSASAFLTAIGGASSGSGLTSASLGFALINGYFTAVHSSNDLVITIVDSAGSTPSAGSPVDVLFRSGTISSGAYTKVSLTGAKTYTIVNGCARGALSSTPFRIWVLAINDNGTIRIGTVNASNQVSNSYTGFIDVTAIYPLRDHAVVSTVPDVGSVGVSGDAALTIYSEDSSSSTVTITNASPAVVSWTGHNLASGQAVVFTTTGSLPTGITAGTTYYVLASGYTSNSFEISTTIGGTAVNTSTAGSGTHTCHAGIAQCPARVIGYFEYYSLATAGSWGTNPDIVHQMTPATPLPGHIVQSVRSGDGLLATGSTTFPADNTVPQSGEGNQYYAVTLTPTSKANLLRSSSQMMISHSGVQTAMVVALFQDSISNTMACSMEQPNAANVSITVWVDALILGQTNSSTTIKARCGGHQAGTTTINGQASTSQFYGGAFASYLEAFEVMG